MTLTPRPWQLKGAAVAHSACRGPFKGVLIGDGMGLGKTLVGILAVNAVRDEPGMSLVVAPKGVCQIWKKSIEDAFEPVGLCPPLN